MQGKRLGHPSAAHRCTRTRPRTRRPRGSGCNCGWTRVAHHRALLLSLFSLIRSHRAVHSASSTRTYAHSTSPRMLPPVTRAHASRAARALGATHTHSTTRRVERTGALGRGVRAAPFLFPSPCTAHAQRVGDGRLEGRGGPCPAARPTGRADSHSACPVVHAARRTPRPASRETPTNAKHPPAAISIERPRLLRLPVAPRRPRPPPRPCLDIWTSGSE
mmetsp:Transcript_10961/g.29717  ORF Transcript_10961/g.29717 Transcript_10961/m.29717 type:complete len:219 (-) Transcript_10961:2189-2845(-)